MCGLRAKGQTKQDSSKKYESTSQTGNQSLQYFIEKMNKYVIHAVLKKRFLPWIKYV